MSKDHSHGYVPTYIGINSDEDYFFVRYSCADENCGSEIYEAVEAYQL